MKIYESIFNEKNELIEGRTKLFIIRTDENGNIISSLDGASLIPSESGTMCIVDDWLIDQLDKVIFKDGTLQVKDGETLDEPVKTALEREEEELLKRLAELRAKKTADTEDITDEP